MVLIRIKGDADTAVLRDITSAIEPDGRSCLWSLLAIEGVARGNVLGQGVLSLEEAVNDSPTGLTLAWDDVKELADSFTDVWFIRLIGSQTATDVRRDASLKSLVCSAAFVVDRFDSGDWLISCQPDTSSSRLLAGLGDRVGSIIDL